MCECVYVCTRVCADQHLSTGETLTSPVSECLISRERCRSKVPSADMLIQQRRIEDSGPSRNFPKFLKPYHPSLTSRKGCLETLQADGCLHLRKSAKSG